MHADNEPQAVYLSIIIPSHGRHQPLDQLLHHFIEQITYANLEKHIELIVVDDGSTPALNPPTGIGSISLNWVRLETNTGAPAARKLGFERSNGMFIHFHDSDDDIGSNWIATIFQHILRNPDFDLLISARKVNCLGGARLLYPKFVAKHHNNPTKIIRWLQFENCIGPLGGVTFSRCAVNKIRFNDLMSCQDWDMYLDAIDSNSNVEVDVQIQFLKNESAANRISASLNKKVLGHLKLARIHTAKVTKCLPVRLFYIYCINRSFKKIKSNKFSAFCKKNYLKLIAAYIIIRTIKLSIDLTP